MKTIALLLIMLCGTVYGQTAYRFCNPQYGVKDPREYLPESLYTNCVLWMPMNNDPTKLASWGVPDGSWFRNNLGQGDANRRPVYTNTANGCLLFNGSDDWLKNNASGISLPTTTGTYMTWCKVSSTNNGGGLIECGDSSANNMTLMYLTGTGSGTLALYGAGQGSANNVWQGFYGANTLNTWCHFAISFNTVSDTYIGYKNGNYLATVSSLTCGNPTAITNIYIGGNRTGAIPINGLVDLPMIFNRVLSSNEVAYIYNQTKGTH